MAILPAKGTYFVACFSALCYGVLAIVEATWPNSTAATGLPTAQPANSVYLGYFLTVAATLFITAYIANYFAGLLKRDENTIRQQLDEMNALYTVTRSVAGTVSTHGSARRSSHAHADGGPSGPAGAPTNWNAPKGAPPSTTWS